jgi:signal transduction histidine kinase
MWLEAPARLLLRTSGFRLALRSLALSLGGAVLVFVIIHHAAETIWREQIDATISGALTDILSDQRTDKQPLAQNVRETMAEGGGLFYAAIGPDHRVLAGNFRLSPEVAAAWTGTKTLRRQNGLTLPPRVVAIRGTARRFPDGKTLFIAADASALRALDQLIARSFLAVFGTIMALGLLSGYLAARATLHRVDTLATTIRDIMEGDLSRRAPVGGSGDEFDRLATALNAMLQRLEELMDNLRQVTNDISHDLRSPLARLRGHLELSRDRFTGPGLPEMFDEALLQIDQALEIFAAMLRIAEVEAGARRAHFCPVALSSLLTMLAESYEPAFTAGGIAIAVDIAPGLTLQGDKDLLAQMFTNLLDNIMLHASGASLAHVQAMRVDGQIEIAISDDGCGIPSNQHARVFQRFVRLDASRHLPGHGLGLSLAVAIAALHGGKVTVDDNRPGLRVIVNLPALAYAPAGANLASSISTPKYRTMLSILL